MTRDSGGTQYDAESDIAAWVVGSGMMLIQASAVIVGLLPCLLLLLPLALPLLVLPLAGLPVALAVGIWRLAARAARSLRGHGRPIPAPATGQGATSSPAQIARVPSRSERST